MSHRAMPDRALAVPLLTGVLLVGLAGATTTPAAAQGDPVSGLGNVYHLSGAYNDDGIAQALFEFGDAGDEVYFGDWYGDGVDLPMVRRGNVFFVPDPDAPGVTAAVFAYGDAEDEVYVGDWDGDGVDSLTVRRGNVYFVKNDNRRSGVADRVFAYGDPDDVVLVGNWDGPVVPPTSDHAGPGKGDTLTVRRGNEFFVRNELTSGVAQYSFLFGDPDDEVLVGDWAPRVAGPRGETASNGTDGDQFAVRRGNEYHLSSDVSAAARSGTNPATTRVFAYGDPEDDVFVAAFPTPVDVYGVVIDDFDAAARIVWGDGLGVRRLG